VGHGMVRWGSPETPSHKQTNDYEIYNGIFKFRCTDLIVSV